MNKIFISIFSIFIILFNQILRLSANDNTYINSSNITYNESENIVELAENSKINYKNTNILIDKGIIDYEKNEFEVFGNFYLYEELTILSGQNLRGNTSLNVFSANDVSYIYNDDLKIDSNSLDKDENLIYFYNNFLTPCELEGYFNCPTWSLRIDKTEYNIEEDKFTHFDTFLQIADYKVFYLPYFAHYGVKAPRKKGFLTPTIEFTIGGDQGLILPYYLPVNLSTDIVLKPKIFINESFKFLEKYELNTLIENKSSGGGTSILIDNIKNKSQDINTSINFKTKQILSKNKIISASGFFTNSISTTRSTNEESITFEDLFLRIENYDFFTKDDYLNIELASIETFEPANLNTIPISPNLSYINSFEINDKILINGLNFTVLKRNESDTEIPSNVIKIDLNNELVNNSFYNDNLINKKVILNNSFNEYYFKNDQSLNHDSIKSFLILSSDINLKKFRTFTPKVKFIAPIQLINSSKIINEDSESITFSYQNQFSENRFFGNDLFDNSPRIVYGIENYHINDKYVADIKINQSYDIKKNSSYSNKINQNSRFSDYAIDAKLEIQNTSLKFNSRLDQASLSKKEMNYSIISKNIFDLSINYNETQAEAFEKLSNDTQSIDFTISKKINNNLILGYSSNLDVKNNYNPYQSLFKVSIFDECSQLEIDYSNTRYSDNFNTKPEEKISLTFRMDYLGFFGYEQSTSLFFSKPGNLNYGL